MPGSELIRGAQIRDMLTSQRLAYEFTINHFEKMYINVDLTSGVKCASHTA